MKHREQFPALYDKLIKALPDDDEGLIDELLCRKAMGEDTSELEMAILDKEYSSSNSTQDLPEFLGDLRLSDKTFEEIVAVIQEKHPSALQDEKLKSQFRDGCDLCIQLLPFILPKNIYEQREKAVKATQNTSEELMWAIDTEMLLKGNIDALVSKEKVDLQELELFDSRHRSKRIKNFRRKYKAQRRAEKQVSAPPQKNYDDYISAFESLWKECIGEKITNMKKAPDLVETMDDLSAFTGSLYRLLLSAKKAEEQNAPMGADNDAYKLVKITTPKSFADLVRRRRQKQKRTG